MKARIYSLLLAFTVLFAFGCTDHEVPTDKVYPTIETLEFTFPEEESSFEIYHVNFTSLGNQQIVEYGLVMSAQNVNGNDLPDVNDSKFPFSAPVALGQRTRNIEGSEVPALIEEFKFSYRAYAITDDGMVVYGNTISKIYTPL